MNKRTILRIIRYFCLIAALIYFYMAYINHKNAYYFVGICFMILYLHKELFDQPKLK